MLLLIYIVYGALFLFCGVCVYQLALLILLGLAYRKIARKLGLKNPGLTFVPILRLVKLRGILSYVKPGDRTLDKLCVASGVLSVGTFNYPLGKLALMMAGWYTAASLYEKFVPEKYMLLTCVSLLVPFGAVPCLFYAAKKIPACEADVIPEDIDSGEKI